tara:strand:- start:11051 stop:12769 length:1719 start_codon:yes stop_codon:yes gene_type:complete
MARNRVIYQSEAVFVSQDVPYTGQQTGTSDVATLHGIQSANYSFNVSRQDVNCFGELAAVDRIITEAPTVSFDTSYYISNLGNENKLGFRIWGDPSTPTNTRISCISGIIDADSNDGIKNYYILTTKEGSDAVDNTNANKYESIIGLGNVSITSYSTEASVGGLPTASVSAEGQNLNFINLPYTGMYDGYTGAVRQVPSTTTANQTGMHPEDKLAVNYFKNLSNPGFGSEELIYISITGHNVAEGADQIIDFAGMSVANTNGALPDGPFNRESPIGATVTIPEGIVFSGGANGASPKTITTSTVVEKDSTQMIGTVDGGTVAVNELYTGVCSGAFITNISGSNPAVIPADGTIASWSGYIGGTNSAQTNGWLAPTTVANAAPITLPIPPKSLTASGTNPTGSISTLRPGDITFSLTRSDGTANLIEGATISDAPLQSYSISFDMGRTAIDKIGSRFAFARPVDFPVTATLSLDALVTDITTGTVSNIVNCDESYDATIILSKPLPCGPQASKEPVVCYEAKGLKLESQSYTSTIGDNKSVTFDFSCQIGSPEQTDVGIFMSGYYTGTAGLWS